MVGCVIVHNNRIIGEGWHQKAGTPHAEVNAIESVKQKELLPESTLYVNLEPCSHQGRTPPCADFIIENRIRKVVIGSVDTNEKVGGKGVKRLLENGVEVVSPVLENACRELNKRFYTFHEQKRPYIILKWAESRDGFIFPEQEKALSGSPYWISNKYSRQRVHQWRAEEAAILVGKNTVMQDDPELTPRDFKGNPILRLVIDRRLEIPMDKNIFDDSCPTFIYNEIKQIQKGSLTYVRLNFDGNVVRQLLDHLHENEIQSLIIEGGTYTIDKFIQTGLWDEARVFTGQADFKKGMRAPIFEGVLKKEIHIQDNVLRIYKPGL